MDLLPLDVNKICRFCLTNETVVSIFSSGIIIMVKKLDLLKLDLEYTMPSSICQSCVYRLMEAYNFKQQIETSECRIREYITINSANTSQFPYLTDKLVDFSDRIDDENVSFTSKLPFLHFSSTQIPSSTISSPQHHQYDAFSSMHIFESNNSEDIEVADVEIDVSSLTRSDGETIQDTILDIDENPKIIVDFSEPLDYIEHAAMMKIENNNNDEKLQNNNENNNISDNTNSENANFNSFINFATESTIIKTDNITKTIETQLKKGRRKKSAIIQPKCLECGKQLKTLSHLEVHQRIHNGEKPFHCKICNKTFAQIGNYRLHVRMHNGDRRYQCELCSNFFSTSSNLKSHMASHTDVRTYKCLKCERSFKAKLQLNRHIATHDQLKEFQCHLCDKLFLNKTYLRVHFETVHEQKKRFKCNDCGQKFSSSSNYKVHSRIHTGEKPYACKFCDAKFNQSSALSRHIKTHSNLSSSRKKNCDIETNSIISENVLPIIDNPRGNMIISEYLPNEIISIKEKI